MKRRTFMTSLSAAATQKLYKRDGLVSQDTDIDFRTRVAARVDLPSVTTTRYPYIQNARNDRVSILWATLESGTGIVEYSSDGVNFNRAIAQSRLFRATDAGSPADFIQYQADITDLQPSTDYTYRVSVNGSAVTPGGDWRFRTAGPGPFNFVVLGDSGWDPDKTGNEEQYVIAQSILSNQPSLVIHTGDVVYYGSGGNGGNIDLYQRNYFNYYSSTMSSVPFFPTPGNHDYVNNLAPYLAVHALPSDTTPAADSGRYYSYDWGNVHFISLDAHGSLDAAVNSGGPMLQWLEDDLRTTRKFWRVVYFHYPPFAAGPNMNDPHSAWVRQFVIPILETYGVQIALSGHEHSYQRSQPIRKFNFVTPDIGTTYISSGGGGASLYPVFDYPVVACGKQCDTNGTPIGSAHHYLRAEVRGTRMTIHAIRYDGVEIDSYTVAPRPVFSDDPNRPPVVMAPGPTTGAIVRIYGRALAAEEASPSPSVSGRPTELVGTTVSVNGTPIPLLYVSSSEMYAQLPSNVDGNIVVRVTTANGFSEISI